MVVCQPCVVNGCITDAYSPCNMCEVHIQELLLRASWERTKALKKDDYIKTTNIQHLSSKPVLVYTDGACINNGRVNAKAGWGVYVPSLDIKLKGKIIGKQTNQVAELTALIKAYHAIHHIIQDGNPVVIYTDSLYGIRCCTTYGEKCNKKQWSDKIPNMDLVKQAWHLFSSKNIEFKHIKAHTGCRDEHSIGNEEADRLAVSGIHQSL